MHFRTIWDRTANQNRQQGRSSYEAGGDTGVGLGMKAGRIQEIRSPSTGIAERSLGGSHSFGGRLDVRA